MAVTPRASGLALIGTFAILSATTSSGGAQVQSQCGESVAVEAGDTLRRIAERCGISVSVLLSANPDISNPDIIHTGQKLTIPGDDNAGSRGASAGSGATATDAADGDYQAESGDTLYSIADKLGMPVADVIEANPGLDPSNIPIGRVLDLPSGDSSSAAAISVSAGYAAPGERLSIRASGFPPDEPVEIGAGPPQSEFEIIARPRSDSRGGVQQALELPSWASKHRELVFVAQTLDGRISAISDPILTVEQSGGGDAIRVTGQLLDGVECPALRSDDGTLYTLAMPDGQEYQTGDRVEVWGAEAEASICMQGTTLEVQRIQQVQ